MGITTTQLADKMNLSKGRISQLVKQGVFDGCFKGEGRARRFDLAKCLNAYGDKTDIRQGTGNAGKTRAAVEGLQTGMDLEGLDPRDLPGDQRPTSDSASRRLNEARAQKAELEVQKLVRIEREEEGAWVRADEVAQVSKRLMSQELAKFEALLKDMARLVADKNALNFKEVRADMMKVFRDARTARAETLREVAEEAAIENTGAAKES